MVRNINTIRFTERQSKAIISRFGKDLFNKAMHNINVYIEKWQLTEVNLFEFFSSNLIILCVSPTYGLSVLKIQMSNDNMEKEVAILRLFNGRRFCKIYEYSAEDRVCLLEKVSPGETLFFGTTREERILLFCELYSGLHTVQAEQQLYPTYLNWLEEGEYGVKQRADCVSILPFLQNAKEMFLSINAKYTRSLLLHGDLHHENILKNQAGSYTVIDPKGVIGDPVFDVSRFILDEFHDDLTSEPIENVISLVNLLSKGLNTPMKVLLGCLYIETVIWLCREELSRGESIKNCDWLIRNMKVANTIINNPMKE